MAYHLPNYIINEKLDTSSINYQWDDTKVFSYLNVNFNDDKIEQITPLSLRAKITLAIGIYEWVLGRVGLFSRDSLAFDIAEAAWCANVNKRYITYIDYPRNAFMGPIEGVLWCGFMSLTPLLYVSSNVSDLDNPEPFTFLLDGYDDEQWQREIPFLIALVSHILPLSKVELFNDWLNQAIMRLSTWYPAPEENEFDNLFGYPDDKIWLGDYIAREVLDPNINYQPNMAVPLLNHFLFTVNRSNPLLNQDLIAEMDTPFMIPSE